MSDKCLSYLLYMFGLSIIILANTAYFLFSYIPHVYEMFSTMLSFFYYFLVGTIYLGLFGLIVKNSFEHVEQIIKLSVTLNWEINCENMTNDTKVIFKHILLNLLFIIASVCLSLYFDFKTVKGLLILYVCWTLGFTTSLRISNELATSLNNDQLKDYILLKSIINTSLFLLIYLIIKYLF